MFGIVVLLALVPLCFAQPDIVLTNNKLFVNGQEFFIKGIDYNPTPLGIEGMAPSGFGGGGYCSARLDPVGDYKSACYDSDYVDGGPDYSTDRTGPTSWFAAVWQRDFPKIIEMGFNTVRLYGANPTTLQVTELYTNLFPGGQGKDHTQFMAYAAASNLKVIFPLYSDYGAFLNDDFPTFARFLRWQIDEVGNYSSLIMWQLGNELGYTGNVSHPGLYNDPTGMTKYNSYADYARRYTYSKWGRFIPITTAIIDLPITYDTLTVQYHVDVLSVNVFRGVTFTNLFTGSFQFKGFNYSICATGKPILISEFGMYPYVNGAINQIWQSVINSIDFGVVGAAYFEFIDEPIYNKTWGAFAVSVQYSGGTNSNTSDAFLTDNITPKQQFYDLINGTYNGQQYNIPADVFTLLGRSATTPQTSTDRCAGFLTCPGSGGIFPFCSGNGACNRVTGVCDCVYGWNGNDCATPACPNSCSNNGQCSTIVTPPQCVCNSGFFGSDCSQTVSSSACPNSCSNGNGVCNSNVCTCISGWSGADCGVVSLSRAFVTTTTGTGATSTTTATTATAATSTTGTATTASTASISTTGASTTATTATNTVASVATTGTTKNSAAKYVPGLVLILSLATACFI